MNEVESVKFLKLPFHFDRQKLLDDLEQVLKIEWKDHFNTRVYTGKWKSIPLYAPNGDRNNIFAIPNEKAPVLPTDLIQDCHYFKELLGQFECPLLSVRLLNLGPGAYIKPHKDFELGYEDGCFRIHIPIKTNDDVEFILADHLLKMLPGECWYTNVNYTHSVANKSNEDRIHLVFDGARNEWSDALFFPLASEDSLLQKNVSPYEDSELPRIIEELEALNPPNLEEILRSIKKDS